MIVDIKGLADAGLAEGQASNQSYPGSSGASPVIKIASKKCQAHIATLGGHVVRWLSDDKDQLWLSQQKLEGKPLRGGIPICWPWFGPHPSNPALPNHGWARTSQFLVVEHTPDAVVMHLTHGALRAELTVRVDESLSLSLTTVNLGREPQTVGAAFHTYFRVSDIETVRILGLDGTKYLDQLQDHRFCHQVGNVVFEQEVDRIYQTNGHLVVEDSARQTSVESCNSSNSTVVWNPWRGKSAMLGDMGIDEFKRMVCVETAWAGEDVRTISPGTSMTLTAVYRSVAL